MLDTVYIIVESTERGVILADDTFYKSYEDAKNSRIYNPRYHDIIPLYGE